MQIKYSSEEFTPYGGLIIINELLRQRKFPELINNQLGSRGAKSKYSFSDILLSIIYSQFSNGSSIEDIIELKRKHLSSSFPICSPDTALDTLEKLSILNEAHLGVAGGISEINHNPVMNNLLFSLAVKTGGLVKGKGHCVDFDTTVVTHEKYDARHTYNMEQGYNPLVAAVGALPVYIEGRSGNTSPALGLHEALKKVHGKFTENGLTLSEIRIDSAGYQNEIMDYCDENKILSYIRAKNSKALTDAILDTMFWNPIKGCIHKTEIATTYLDVNNSGKLRRVVVTRRKNKKAEDTLLQDVDSYTYYSIITNDEVKSDVEVYEFYNGRGTFEQNNSSLKNEFNWKHLPCSFLSQNTVFMIISAMGKVLFEYLKRIICQKAPEFIKNTGVELKAFINRFVTVVAKWVRHGRRMTLNLYTDKAYHLLLE